MTRTEEWIPEEIALDQPNVARIYDYLLDGYHNFEIDRVMADRVIQINPDFRLAAHVNRAFLRRCVRFLAEQGIDQFLEVGSGLPTAGHVHEIAQEINPAARVVYVDIDPVAVAHSQAMLHGSSTATVIRADARQPDQILDHAEFKRLLDLSRPAAVLFCAILHLIPDDQEAYYAVSTLRDVLAPGSYVAVSHPSRDDAPPEMVDGLNKSTARASANYQFRRHAQIGRFFDGLELVEPGLVFTPLWRPEGPDDLLVDQPERAYCLAGIGYRP